MTDDCWCHPILDYTNPQTGDQVWIHNEQPENTLKTKYDPQISKDHIIKVICEDIFRNGQIAQALKSL